MDQTQFPGRSRAVPHLSSTVSPGAWRPSPEEVGSPPSQVLPILDGRSAVPVWLNEIGGVTWQIGDGDDREFLKVGPAHPEFQVVSDVERLRWLQTYVPVPAVLDAGVEDGVAWLLTQGLPGTSAVDLDLMAGPEEVVDALGLALRRFHDAVPLGDCPFTWSVADRGGLSDGRHVPSLDPVVCHGDACTPNTLLVRTDCRLVCSGYVDVGSCGVADRWADLAPALMSLSWNLPAPEGGSDWTARFLQAYGIEKDSEKLSFYADLWNAG